MLLVPTLDGATLQGQTQKGFVVRAAWHGHWKVQELTLSILTLSFTSAESKATHKILEGLGYNPVGSDLVQNLPLRPCCIPDIWPFVSNLSMRRLKLLHLPFANVPKCQ